MGSTHIVDAHQRSRRIRVTQYARSGSGTHKTLSECWRGFVCLTKLCSSDMNDIFQILNTNYFFTEESCQLHILAAPLFGRSGNG